MAITKKTVNKTGSKSTRLNDRQMGKARHCANCHWHWKPRGWHKDWKQEIEPSFCMLDIPQEDIDYVVHQIEYRTGYDPDRYTRRLIQIMGVNEDNPLLVDLDNPRWLRGEEDCKCCQFYKKSKGCICR